MSGMTTSHRSQEVSTQKPRIPFATGPPVCERIYALVRVSAGEQNLVRCSTWKVKTKMINNTAAEKLLTAKAIGELQPKGICRQKGGKQ